MSRNVGLKPIQEKFIALFLQGIKIGEAARQCDITEETASRWLKNPLVQSEIERRQTAMRETAEQAEQEAITRILTDGYALMHRRVEALKNLSLKLEKYLEDEEKVWLPDVKSVGTGPTAERVDLVQFNDALIREYRATFDDLAKELGQRVKKQEIEHGGLIEVLNTEHASLLADLETLPNVGQVKTEDTTTSSDPA